MIILLQRLSDLYHRPGRASALLPWLSGIMLLGVLSGCATYPENPDLPVIEEQENYAAHARSYYEPPGPPDDPWGPYIREASERFDVPELWIRTVINKESSGRLFDSQGHFITSTPGAMGLMQIMPPAYDDLRRRYDLGPDPYAPHDNIIAGTAYIRQMYDIYGSPGFLAAYNDGPGNLDRYLRQNRLLPKETRNYVADIGRQIAGVWPQHRSDADLKVARFDPAQRGSLAEHNDYIDPAPFPSSQHPITSGSGSVSAAWAARGFAPTPPPALGRISSSHGPRSISSSYYKPETANTVVRVKSIPLAHPPATSHQIRTDIPNKTGHGWAIQVGAFNTNTQANHVAAQLRKRAGTSLQQGRLLITPLTQGRRTLYRTRFTNLSQEQAQTACQYLRAVNACMLLSPNAHF